MGDIINFYGPHKVSELENDAGYVTQATVIVNHEFPDSWNTSGTMNQLIDSIQNDNDAIEGQSYIGTVSISDLPSGLIQAELKVDITKGSTAGNKIIVFTIESEDVSPYHWERVAAYNRTGTWRSFIPNGDIGPIVLSALPTGDTDTVTKLNNVGLTQSEFLAASQGKRTGVVYNGNFYNIQQVTYTSDTVYSMIFSQYGMYKLPPEAQDDTLYYWETTFYRITRNGNYVGCNVTTIPANTPV